MRLLEAGVKGFGKLVNRKFNFDDGFNLIYGRNEEGKTTLWKFLIYCLFGYDRTDPHDYTPWNGAEYGGYCIYELSNGQRYRISRNFKRNTWSFYDLSKGIDMSDLLAEREKDIITEQLGIGLKTFEAFTTIPEIRPEMGKEEKANISLKLGSLVEREEEIGRLKKVIERVENEVEEIGVNGSADSSMIKLKMNIRELKSKLETLKEKDNRKRRLIKQIHELKSKLNDVDKKIEALEADLKALHVQECKKKLDEIVEKRSRLEEVKQKLLELSKYKDVQADKRDEMVVMDAKIREIEKSISSEEEYLKRQQFTAITIENEMNGIEKDLSIEGETDFETISLKVQNIQLRYDMLEEKVKHLQSIESEFSDFVRETQDKIEKLKEYKDVFVEKHISVDELRELQREAETVVDSSEKRELEEQKKQLEDEKKKIHSLIWWLIGGISTAIVGSAFGYLLNPYLYSAGGAGLLVLFLSLVSRAKLKKSINDTKKIILLLEQIVAGYEEKREKAKRKLKTLLSETGFSEVEEVEKAYKEYLELKEEDYERKASKYKMEIEELKKTISSYREELIKMVEMFVSPLEKERLKETVEHLINQVQRYKKLLLEKARVKASIQRTQERLKQYKIDKENSLRTLRNLYEKVKVQSIEEYDELLAKRDEYNSLKFIEKELKNSLKESKSEEEERMRKEVEENSDLLNRQVDLSSANIQIDLRRYRLERENTIAEMKKKQELLESETEEENIGNLRMKLALAEKELNDTISYSNSLLLVRRLLSSLYERVKNDFIPKLRKELKDSIYTITNGEYEEVEVDKEFNVTLIRKDRKVEKIAMSKGMKEQVRFAVMFSLGRIFSRNSEPLPFLLDDPFVDYDSERYEMALNLLYNVSKENQIILFTCRSDIKELLHSRKDVLILELK